MHQNRAYAHDGEGYADDVSLSLQRNSALFFERLDVGAIDFCFADPRVAARRAVREKEGGKQEKRRGGKHGDEHAQKTYGESQPGAGEEDGLFHEGSYRQVLHAGRPEALCNERLSKRRLLRASIVA